MCAERPTLLLVAAAWSQMYSRRAAGHYISSSFCPVDVAGVERVEMEAVNHFQLTGSHCCTLAYTGCLHVISAETTHQLYVHTHVQ